MMQMNLLLFFTVTCARAGGGNSPGREKDLTLPYFSVKTSLHFE